MKAHYGREEFNIAPMERKSGQQGKGAIEILEEAVHLLRLSPASLLPVYYIGTLPFVLGFLYFFADMSRSAFADEYCASASLGLAMLFIWMKCWHTIFSRKIMEQLSFEQAPRWSPAKICRLAAIQTLIQSSGLFVLPIALILTIPFGWSYAFYHNVVVLGDGDGSDVKTICERSWQQAKLW
ncbi:MAG: hypothetical protein SV375_16535, partial [Thermodesulfobacteriota bacterium]|nr:hypothetical protein [Thermodesulfobacteriota bacterium]